MSVPSLRQLVQVCAFGSLVMTSVAGCSPPTADRTRGSLRQPTGLVLGPGPDALIFSQGNWDRREAGGSLGVLDLRVIDAMLGGGEDLRCARGDEHLRCEVEAAMVGEAFVALGSGVGTPVWIDPDVADRLLVPVRGPAAITWMDVSFEGGDVGSIRFDCGASDGCDDRHTVTRLKNDPSQELPADPSRILVDRLGYPFAYVPHLLEGGFSLLRLDGDLGPELVDVERDVFQADSSGEAPLAGGFAVAERPCSPAIEGASSATTACGRPFLLVTERYWPGLRALTVAPGLDVVIPGAQVPLASLSAEVVDARPLLGDLDFEDSRGGTSLLVVQTTPPALLRVDTRIDETGQPGYGLRGAVGLCEDPNILEVVRDAEVPTLALVTCFRSGTLAVVDLRTFTLIADVPLDDGAQEIVFDPRRRLAYVANTRGDSISVVDLDAGRASYLTEVLRLVNDTRVSAMAGVPR